MDGTRRRQGSIFAPGSPEGKCGQGDGVAELQGPPCVDGMIGDTDAEPRLHPAEQLEGLLEQMREKRNEEPGREKTGARLLIDPWSEGLCPSISPVEEKDLGLRCFRISLFGV